MMELISSWFANMPGLGSLWLSIKLGLVTTTILIVFGTPLAFWLSRTRSHVKTVVEALVALPIVLPPTVLGFYLLILLGPSGVIGGYWVELTGSSLTFSFIGLVVASILYSMPFVIQPLQNAFESVSRGFVEALEYAQAHALAAMLLVFSFVCMFALYFINRRWRHEH